MKEWFLAQKPHIKVAVTIAAVAVVAAIASWVF